MNKRLLFILSACLIAAAGYSSVTYHLNEGFESVSAGVPAGWSQDCSSATYVEWGVENANLTSPTGAYAGTSRMAWHNTTEFAQYESVRLVTPVMNLASAWRPMLTFAHAQANRAGAFDTLRVYYRNAPTRPWVLMREFTSSIARWRVDSILLPAQSSQYQVAFEVHDNFGSGIVLDDVRVFNSSLCTGIVGLGVEPRSSSAVFSFASDDQTFELIVHTSPIDNLDTDTVGVYFHNRQIEFADEMSYTVRGLKSKTHYYAYARSYCDDNESGYTPWVSADFVTSLGYPLMEDFTGLTDLPEGWSLLRGELADAYNGTLPQPYTLGTSSSYYGWTFFPDRSNTLFHSGNFMRGYGYYYNEPYWLVTPALDFTDVEGLSAVGLTFDLALTSAQNRVTAVGDSYRSQVHFYVLVSEDGGQSWTKANTFEFDAASLTTTLQNRKVDLTDYIGRIIQLAFVVHNDSYYASAYFALDNISMGAIDPNCRGLYGLSATCSGSNATVSWNVRGTSTNLVLLQLSTDPTFSQIVREEIVSGNSFTLDKLATGGSMYYVRVRQDCDAAEWISTSFSTPCATITTFPWTETFEGYAIGSSSEPYEPVCGSNTHIDGTGTYRFYVSSNQGDNTGHVLCLPDMSNGTITDLALPRMYFDPAEEYIFQLDVYRTTGYPSYALEGLHIYLSPTEQKDSVNSVLIGMVPRTIAQSSATVPSVAQEGWYTYSFPITMTDSAYIIVEGYSQYGAATYSDNYKVLLAPACRNIRELSAVATATDATVTFHQSNASVYEAVVTIAPFADPATAPADSIVFSTNQLTATSFDVDELTPRTTYYVYVRGLCDGGEIGEWASTSFTTECGALQVTIDDPWTEDFNSYTTGNFSADCWKNEHFEGTSSSVFNITTDTRGGNSTKKLQLPDMQRGNRTVLSLPAVDMELENEYAFQLSIYRHNGTYSSAQYWTEGIHVYASLNSTLDDSAVELAFVPRVAMANSTTVPAVDEEGWYTYEFVIPLAGEVHVLLVGESQYGAATFIDNLQIRHLPACKDMWGLNVLSTQTHGASIRFANTHASSYRVSVADHAVDPEEYEYFLYDEEISTYSHVINDENLEPNTEYYLYVCGLCVDEGHGGWASTTFRTLCEAVSVEDFGQEDFSQAGNEMCWTFGFTTQGTSTAQSQVTRAGRESSALYGDYLRLSKSAIGATNSNGVDTVYNDGAYAVTPAFEVGDTINRYAVTFSAAAVSRSSQVNRLIIGVITDPNDINTMEVIKTVNLEYAANEEEVKTYTVNLDSYIGDIFGDMGQHIIFWAAEAAKHDSTNVVLIDNVSLAIAGSCAQVIQTGKDGVSSYGARAYWEDLGAETYQVMLCDINTKRPDTIVSPISLDEAPNTEWLYDNLVHSTAYYIYIRAICGEGDTARWSNPIRLKTSFALPYYEPFTDGGDDWRMMSGSAFTADSLAASALGDAHETFNWTITDNVPAGMTAKAARALLANNTRFGEYNAWLVSSEIDMTNHAGEFVRLTFDAARTNVTESGVESAPSDATDYRMYVVVSTDNGNSWKRADIVATWTCDGNGDYDYNAIGQQPTAYSIGLSKYAGQKIRLGFYVQYATATSRNYIYVDNIRVETYDGSCNGVRRLALTHSGRSVTASWELEGTPDEVIVQIATDEGFTDIVDSQVIKGDSLCSFSDLNFSTIYFIRAKQNGCNEQGWVVRSFRTELGTPFSEYFTDSAIPADWTVMTGTVEDAFSGIAPKVNTATYGTWRINSSTFGVINGNHAYINTYSTNGHNAWLVSPLINLSDIDPSDDLRLSFNVAYTDYNSTYRPGSDDALTLYLLISTDDGATWQQPDSWEWSDRDAIAAVVNPTASIQGSGSEVILDIARYAGLSIRFAFVSKYHTGDADFHVDNIRLRKVIPGCDAPTLTSVTGGDGQVVVEWTGDEDKQTIIELATNETFSAGIRRDTVAAGVTTATVVNLSASTTYYVRVRHLCDLDAGEPSATMSAATACGAINNFPWTEGFETYTTSSRTALTSGCWSILAPTSNAIYASTNSDYVHSGSKCLYFGYRSSYSIADGYAILPQLDELDNLHISFYYSYGSSSSSGILTLGYMTDITSASSFVPLQSYPHPASAKTSYLAELDLDGIPAEAVAAGARLAFRYAGGIYYYYAGIDDITVTTLSQCRKVRGLQASNVSSDSAVVSFTGLDIESTYRLVVATAPLDMDNLTEADQAYILVDDSTLEQTSYVLRNLTPTTYYYVYVRALCGDLGNGKWSSAYRLLTDCAPNAMPWEESFDGLDTGDATSAAPLCWDKLGVNEGAAPYAYVSARSTHAQSGKGLYWEPSASTNGYLILPEMTAALNTLRVVFDHKEYSVDYSALLTLGYITDITDASTFVPVATFDNHGTWTTEQVDMDQVPAVDGRLAFRLGASPAPMPAAYYTALDNLLVRRIPACADIEGASISNITSHSAKVLIDSVPDVAQYQLLFTLQPIDPDTLASVDASLIAYNGLVPATATVDNLTDATTYYVYVRTYCSATQRGEWFNVGSLLTDCLPLSTLPWQESFDDFSAAAAFQAECWRNMHTAGAASTLFGVSTATVGANASPKLALAKMAAGNHVQLSLPSLALGQTGDYIFSLDIYRSGDAAEAKAEGIRIFASHDGTIDSTDVQLAFIPRHYAADGVHIYAEDAEGWYTYSFPLPLHDDVFVLLRAEGADGAAIYVDNMAVTASPLCPAIATRKLAEVEAETALMLIGPDVAEQYRLVATTEAIDPDTLAQVAESLIALDAVYTTDSLLLEGLRPQTTYYVYVAALCESGLTGQWTAPVVFTTECAPVLISADTPWAENFEDFTGYSTSSMPGKMTTLIKYPLDSLCWVNEHRSGTSTYRFSILAPTAAINGNATHMLVQPTMPLDNTILLALPNMRIPEANEYGFSLSVLRNAAATVVDPEGVRIFVSRTMDIDETAVELGYISRKFSTYSSDIVVAEKAAGWYTYQFPIPMTGDVHIILLAESGANRAAFAMDDFRVEQLPACRAVRDLAVSDIALSSARVSFTASDADRYQVIVASTEINPSDIDTDSWDESLVAWIDTVSENSVLVNGLNENTAYYVYVRGLCGASERSQWTSVDFASGYLTSFPFAETFDATTIPAYWAQYQGLAENLFAGKALSAATAWDFNTTYAFGKNHPRLSLSGASVRNWLMTPPIAMNGIEEGRNITLTFDLAHTAHGGSGAPALTATDDRFIVAVSTDGGKTWTADHAVVWASDGSGDKDLHAVGATRERVMMLLNDYVGDTIMLGFYGESTVSNVRNDIHIDSVRVDYGPYCLVPEQLQAVVEGNRVDISWTGDADSYEVAVGPAGFELAEGADSVYTVSATSLFIEGLLATTRYDVYVRGICGTHTSDWTEGVSFKTDCSLMALPWSENFESYPIGNSSSDPLECWDELPLNQGGTPYAYVNNSTNYVHRGQRSLYFGTSTSENKLVILPQFEAPLNQLQIEFYYKDENDTRSGYLTVGYVTNAADSTSFVPLQTYPRVSSSWQHVELELDIVPASVASTARIALRYSKSASQNYYLGIDDIVVSRMPACRKIRTVTLDDVTATTAHVTFNSTEVPAYRIVAIDSLVANPDSLAQNDAHIAADITVSTEEGTLENLLPATGYYIYVRALCDEDAVGDWSEPVRCVTACVPVSIAELPWSENFDSRATGSANVDDLTCWTINNETSNLYMYVSGNSSYLIQSSKGLYMSGTGTNSYAYAVLPEFEAPLDTLQINFVYRSAYAYGNTFTLGYMTNAADGSTFVALTSYPASTTPAQVREKLYRFLSDDVPAEARLAFRFGHNSSSQTVVVDDIVVRVASSCHDVTDVTVSDIEETAARLSFSGNAAHYHVIVADAALDPDNMSATNASHVVFEDAQLTSTEVAIPGLDASTTYYVYVRALCDTEQSDWSEAVSFHTECGSITHLPWSENFDDDAARQTVTGTYTLPLCWQESHAGTTYVSRLEDNTNGSSPVTYSYSGTTALRLASSSTSRSYVLLPFVETDEAVQLTFMARALYENVLYGSASVQNYATSTYAHSVKVGIITNPADFTTFTEVSTYTLTTLSSRAVEDVSDDPTGNRFWERVTVNIPALNGGYIALVSDFTRTNNVWVDDLRLQVYDPNCQGVNEAVSVSDVSMTSLTAHYSFVQEGAQDAIVAISATPELNLSSALAIDTVYGDTLATITASLEASSTYYVFVRQYCGEESVETGWQSASFRTPIGLRYAPTFETTTLPGDWSRASGLVDDIVAHGNTPSSASSGWLLTAGDEHISTTHFRGNIYGGSWNYWMITPAIDLTPNVGEAINLSFTAALHPYYGDSDNGRFETGVDDRFVVLVSADGGHTWTKIAEWNNQGTGDYVYNEIPATGASYHLDLTAFAGRTIKIGFYGESTEGNADNWFHFGNIVLDRIDAVHYSGHICYGSDYDGANYGNNFLIEYPNYHAGYNYIGRYTAATGSTPEKMEILDLVVDSIAAHEYTITLCDGERYVDENFTIESASTSTPAVMRRRMPSALGCDSFINMYVTVMQPQVVTLRESICSGDYREWKGRHIYTAGVYADTTQSVVSGCDSITNLIITVVDGIREERFVTLCAGESRTIAGQTVTQTGTYRETISGIGTACDTMVTWYVTALPELKTRVNVVTCYGHAYSDDAFHSLIDAGDYSATIASVDGCDSIISLHLVVANADGNAEDYVRREDLPYIVNGQTLLSASTQEGTYEGDLVVDCGTVHLTIHVGQGQGLNNLAAEQLRIAPNPVAVGQPIQILTDFTDYQLRNMRVEVYSAAGSLVYRSGDNVSRTIPGLSTGGMHLVRVTTADKVFVAPVIVQ